MSCRPTPSIQPVQDSPAFPEKPPVVAAPVVDSLSYDEGFQSGYDAGAAAAKPHAKVPSDDEVLPLAAEASAENPARDNNKWRRGWASGYLEGFRARALKVK